MSVLISLVAASKAARACSCIESKSWCSYLASDELNRQRHLVWIGELIDSVHIDINTSAYQFDVKQMFRGEIILPGQSESTADPFYSTFENTDSTVWVMGGPDVTCRRYFSDGTYFMATYYVKESGAPIDFGPYGYTVNFCNEDVLGMRTDSTFEGFLQQSTVPNSQFQIATWDQMVELTQSEACKSTTVSSVPEVQHFEWTVAPNPSSNYFTIFLPATTESRNQLWLKVSNAHGVIVYQNGRFTTPILLGQEWPIGIYYISLLRGDAILTKKWVKL